MYIQFAQEHDLEAIADIHTSCWAEVYPFIPKAVHRARSQRYRYLQWLRVLQDKSPGSALFVLKDIDETTVGFCYCSANEDTDLSAAGELHAAYILPEYRGGITGPLMMSTMVKYLIEHALEPIGLWAFDQNAIQRWYQMLGFTRTIRRDRIIENCAIPESGFICSNPHKLLIRLKPLISPRPSSSESPQYYQSSLH